MKTINSLQFASYDGTRDVTENVIESLHRFDMCAVRSMVMAALYLKPDLAFNTSDIDELTYYRDSNQGGDGNPMSEFYISDESQITNMFNGLIANRMGKGPYGLNYFSARYTSDPFKNLENPRRGLVELLRRSLNSENEFTVCLSYTIKHPYGHIVHITLDENEQIVITSDRFKPKNKEEEENLASFFQTFEERVNSGDYHLFLVGCSENLRSLVRE